MRGIWSRITHGASRPLVLGVPVFLLVLGMYVAALNGTLARYLGNQRTFEVATTFALAGIAIILGVIQFRDAWKHTEKMESIAHSVSTRYVGTFPKNLIDVVKLTNAAKRELLVMAEFVNYGHYWEPEGFEEFLRELELARRRRVTVRFLVYEDRLASQTLQKLLPVEKFDATRDNDQLFARFFSVYPGIDPPKTYDEFLNILRRKEREAASQLFDKGVKIKKMPTQERLFFCIEDDEEAVFSLENVGVSKPLCFRTRDAKLIETFRERFESNWGPARGYLNAVKAASAARDGARGKGTGRKVDISDLPPHSVMPPSDSPKPE